jgi:hypothetical protein
VPLNSENPVVSPLQTQYNRSATPTSPSPSLCASTAQLKSNLRQTTRTRISGLAPPRQTSEAATCSQTPTSGFKAGSESLPCAAAVPMMMRPSRGRRSLSGRCCSQGLPRLKLSRRRRKQHHNRKRSASLCIHANGHTVAGLADSEEEA